MKLSDFKYNLPKTVIAKFPASPRDSARLMVLDRKNETVEHKKFSDIVDYMSKGDVLVVNETKVIFGGQLGNYKYYDIHHVISNALEVVKNLLVI